MRNWIESELELLLTIISMRSRILFIPTLGVVIGIVLTIYLDYSLTNYISNNQDSVYQLPVNKLFEKLHRRVDYFFYLGSLILFIKMYLKERKNFY